MIATPAEKSINISIECHREIWLSIEHLLEKKNFTDLSRETIQTSTIVVTKKKP